MLASIDDIIIFLKKHKYRVSVYPTTGGCVLKLPKHPLVQVEEIYYITEYNAKLKKWHLSARLRSEEIYVGTAPEYTLPILIFISIINICETIGYDPNLIGFFMSEHIEATEDNYLEVLHKPSKPLVYKKMRALLDLLEASKGDISTEEADILAKEQGIVEGFNAIKGFQRGTILSSLVEGEINEPV